jgi:hypothetical protein
MQRITLATLKDATPQEVFDQVAVHLLTQNEQAGSGVCLYRDDQGRSCAAGCLMANDEYDPKFEGFGWMGLTHKHGVDRAHLTLIDWLQEIHDDAPRYAPGLNLHRHWRNKLVMLAENFSLNTDALSKVPEPQV